MFSETLINFITYKVHVFNRVICSLEIREFSAEYVLCCLVSHFVFCIELRK